LLWLIPIWIVGELTGQLGEKNRTSFAPATPAMPRTQR